ncbi:unnamed protein product [Rhizophagus irregularis]|nr:unnamed protein product [Rhizophagus irregularis]CAB4418688.1 unnamed protein product [Rhizophagus irregularis]
MDREAPAFYLILDEPNYEKILFGLPSFREERLYKYNVYKYQQRPNLNPENIPREKKTSLYKVSPRHLELWIEDSFVRIFDQPAFDSLGFAWSRAKCDNIPFWAACNVHFNNNKIKTAPIKSHATLTEISHIGTNLHEFKNLPEIWIDHSRDKIKKTFKDTLYSIL